MGDFHIPIFPIYLKLLVGQESKKARGISKYLNNQLLIILQKHTRRYCTKGGVGKNGGEGGGGGTNNDSSWVSQHNAGRNIELGKKVHTWKHWYIHLNRLKKSPKEEVTLKRR